MLPLEAVVGFVLEPTGLVSSVEIRRSSGFPEVDSAFLEAVRRYRFEPAAGSVVKGRRRFVITSLSH